jgi:CubicO group peptidase (beta-lactamase class C family)
MTYVKAFALIALGLAIGGMSLYIAEVDDAPGGAIIGGLLMVAGVGLGFRAARHRLPTWAARTALAVGLVVAVLAALLTHGVAAAVPLFAQAQDVPSTARPAPSPQHAAAVERARQFVRAAILEQNLPGVSVAAGSGGSVVWAEGFGWRDVVTRTPVTAATRFVIGSAATAIEGAVAPLGLTGTGSDPATAWSPEHVGEPEEDFPPFTIIRHTILQPLGVAPQEYPLPGDRATFYVPRVDDDPRLGRRLMYMRDLACCGDGMAFYSTPSDLVRFALATNTASVNGELARGTVMSLLTERDGIVVAVTSNIAHADTPSLAQRISEAFAEQAR